MKLFLFILRRAPKTTIVAAISSACGGLVSSSMIAFINTVMQRPDAYPNKGWIYFGICALSISLNAFSQTLLTNIGQWAAMGLRMDLNRRILDTPLRQLEEVGSARLMAALTEHVGGIVGAITMIPGLCTSATIVASCLAYLLWLSGSVFLATILGTTAAVLGLKLIMGIAMTALRRTHKDQDALAGHFRTVIDGMKELKLHRKRREDFLSRILYGTELSWDPLESTCRHASLSIL